MKYCNFRTLLIVIVLAMLAANVAWRVSNRSAQQAEMAAGAVDEKESPRERKATLDGQNIMPSVSNLASLGRQWQKRIEALPPELRKKEQAKLDHEKEFFLSVWKLPADERSIKVRERLEILMNDPLIQAEWAAERHRMIAQLASEKRKAIFRNYVQSKEKRNSN